MPRANRFQQPGMICHLTHRCHNGSFLFRFARDRAEYRERLRLASQKYRVSIINYAITSNHIHAIAIESREEGISRMMQMLEGDFGIIYNQRKHRRGAFWGDRYHCTMVEEGEHLWNCVRYVDLNMVRAGVVSHPRDWQCCGYQELVGLKSRYRLLDIKLLLELLGRPDLDIFREEYRLLIQNAIAQKKLHREERWTESIAVGGEEFVRKIAKSIRRERLKPIIKKAGDGSWALWESSSDYGAATDSCLGEGFEAQKCV